MTLMTFQMANEAVKILSNTILSDNWYTLRKIDFSIRLRSGAWVLQSREAYDRGNGATILLYNKEHRSIILTRQFRMPTYLNGNESGYLIEACAGLLDLDNPEDCIRRETEEETGFRIHHVEKIFESYMSPGSVTEILYFFIAEYDRSMKVSEGGGVDFEHEDIEVLEVTFEEALQMVDRGEIKDAKTIMLVQFLRLKGKL